MTGTNDAVMFPIERTRKIEAQAEAPRIEGAQHHMQ